VPKESLSHAAFKRVKERGMKRNARKSESKKYLYVGLRPFSLCAKKYIMQNERKAKYLNNFLFRRNYEKLRKTVFQFPPEMNK
jgi:Mor family transcriptional regulator